MQNFAINGGALNGDPEVWIDESFASVATQAAGSVANGLVLSGAAPVRTGSSLTLSRLTKLEGVAPVQVKYSGSIANGLVLGGSAPISFDASGDFLRWVMIQGVTPTVVDLTGDIMAVASISATFATVLRSDLDLKIATGQSIEGTLPVALYGSLEAKASQSARIIGDASIQLVTAGKLSRITKIGNDTSVEDNTPSFDRYSGAELGGSALGGFAINDDGLIRVTYPGPRLKLSGSARLGAKKYLEGYAVVELHARGSIESLHYVYAGADFKVGILARTEKNGIPTIPGYYVEAPLIRVLRVGEEARRFTVPAERRV